MCATRCRMGDVLMSNVFVSIAGVLASACFVLLCLVTADAANSAGKTYDLVLERITTSPPTSNYLSTDSGAKLRRLNKNSRPGIFWVLNATRQFPNTTNVFAHLYEGSNNAYHNSLVDFKDNFCHYLAVEKRPIFRTLKDVLKLPKSCPFGPAYHKVDNWKIYELLPPVLPGGNKFMLRLGYEFARNDTPSFDIFMRIDRK